MNQIKKARLDKQLSQAELAQKVACSQQHISDIENGKFIPSRHLANQLAETLQMDVIDILYPDD